MAELVIEKQRERPARLVHDIDYEHLHFFIAQARQFRLWNFAIR